MKLRHPKPLWERAKLPLILVAFIGLSEWADPFPFHITLPARIAAALVVLFVAREFNHARLEHDEGWARRVATLADWWKARRDRIPREVWLKLQRVGVWAAVLWAFGAIVNVLTDRCDGAVQCVVLAPRMAIENIPTFLQFALYISLTVFQLGVMFYAMVKVGSFKVVQPGTVGVEFGDVWGQDSAKAKVQEQVRLLEDSEEVEAAGGYMPKGVLLHGPPGTGKTYLAKAAAAYSSKPLILVPPGAFQATFVGINLLKVWTLFRNIRKLARRYGGVIVFIDEIDSLGSRGGDVEQAAPVSHPEGCVWEPAEDPVIVGGGMGTSQMGTLEAFLAAMDGMEEPRGFLNRILVFLGFRPLQPYPYKYLMMGATNRAGALDPALLRAGRFGRQILVDYPNTDGRLRTYVGYLGKVEHDLTPTQVRWAARNHAKGTGAEIKDIVNEALLLTYRDGRERSGAVTRDDLVRAMMLVKFGESDGPFERPSGRWAVAVHEAGHAVAAHHLRRDRAAIWFGSIEQHGRAGGMIAGTPLRDDWLLTRSEMLADIQVALASRVSEEMFFGEVSNGNVGDGGNATNMAAKVIETGAGGQIGQYEGDKTLRRGREAVLEEALEDVRELLKDRKDEIESVARLLADRGTVPGDEIHELLGGAL